MFLYPKNTDFRHYIDFYMVLTLFLHKSINE